MNFPDLIDPSDLGIHFYYEDVLFSLAETVVADWLTATIVEEAKTLRSVRFIFCQDDYLHEINIAYLNHDTLTDVITFPYEEDPAIVDGEIFISIDRIIDNAATYGVHYQKELARVMVHGVLHLCGYGDKGKKEKEKMTERENFYLKKLTL